MRATRASKQTGSESDSEPEEYNTDDYASSIQQDEL